MLKTFSAALIALLISGCSVISPVRYACELQEAPGAACSSMSDAYKQSRQPSTDSHRQSVFQTSKTSETMDTRQDATVKFKGANAGFAEPGEVGMPVFQQPKVMRVWVAPYVDADGTLRSGEYAYFSTPGQWNYGTTRQAGQASGAFGPSKPDALGFKADITKKTATTPPKPQDPAKTSAAVSNTVSTDSPIQGITQPYKRLSETE